jgi:hypothetical protein
MQIAIVDDKPNAPAVKEYLQGNCSACAGRVGAKRRMLRQAQHGVETKQAWRPGFDTLLISTSSIQVAATQPLG